MSIAVTAGSRGIAKMDVILKEVVTYLKEKGAKPSLFLQW